MTILNTGSIGIGTTTPGGRLEVDQTHNGAGASLALVQPDTRWGSTALFQAYRFIQSSSNATDGNFKAFNVGAGGIAIGYFTTPAYNSSDALYVNGNVGIGTTSPDMLLSVGSATPSGNVAHFENSTGSCYINPTTTSLSCSSDERLKTNINSLTASSGLDALMLLNPVTYNWKTESAATSPHTGFIAQQVLPILPDLVSQGPDGYYTLNYAGFTPYIIKAVQEIASISDSFEQNLIAWLGNASNGITDLYATVVHTRQLCVEESDGTPVCITGDQLAAVLAAANQSGAGASGTGSSTPPPPSSDGAASSSADSATPPVLQVNGDNPAVIQVGGTYTDLGAQITGPQADLNLGITTFVNGAPMNPIQDPSRNRHHRLRRHRPIRPHLHQHANRHHPSSER
jgi:hypothetical protein